MSGHFSSLDWSIIGVYIALLIGAGFFFQPKTTKDTKDYFLADKKVPAWLGAISVISATQSAATFLGVPDYSFQHDFTYLAANIGAIMAAIVVAVYFLPKFYAHNVTTVYELLKIRYGEIAMRAAGIMFLIGRILAGGSRVYLAAIAVSMMIFYDINPQGIFFSAFLIIFISFLFTFMGGLKSILWNDLVIFFVYVGSAFGILFYLRSLIEAPNSAIFEALRGNVTSENKLKLFDFSTDLTLPFTMLSIVTGHFLLNLGNFALDQDTTQRLLASKDAKTGIMSLFGSILISIPIIVVFLFIGEFLYIIYNRPDLSGQNAVLAKEFHGEKVTVFMHFILNYIPNGLRGLATTGVLAAAIATTNSALNAMSSVLIEDFYRPWKKAKDAKINEHHFVISGRVGMALLGVLMLIVAFLSYFAQKSSGQGLLQFVLGIMTFAYAGLIGLYFAAIFTNRGNQISAVSSLVAGFLAILLMQPWLAPVFHIPEQIYKLAFTYQLCIGAGIALFVAILGKPKQSMN